MTIVDNESIKITMLEYDPNGDWGAAFTCLIENKTDKTLTFSIDDVSVNDFMCDPYWAETVAPGKKTYSDISWSESSLAGNGINYIENVEGRIKAYDSDDWMADDLFNQVIGVQIKQ